MLNNTGECTKLVDVGDRRAEDARLAQACFKPRDTRPREQRITLVQMTVAFVILGGGLVIALLVYCVELFVMMLGCKGAQ